MSLASRIFRKIKWLSDKRREKASFKRDFVLFKSKSNRNFRLKYEDAVPYLAEKTSTTNLMPTTSTIRLGGKDR
jgi:hypothetical protein